MDIGAAISETEAQLLDDAVPGFVDFSGRPSIRSKSGLWNSASFIIGVEIAEKFACSGISANLIMYLTGPLGQSIAAAAANVNAWNGTASLLPLLGAFIADSFLGRYRTIIISVVLYILVNMFNFRILINKQSLGFMSLSASLHSDCKTKVNAYDDCSPPPLEFVGFYLSLYLAAFAEGGMRPCIQAFGADQFDGNDINESKSKSSFFNWWVFAMSAGALLALLILNYVQDNFSWELGFGIPCVVMFVALLLYLLGSLTYRFRLHSDENNPFVRIGRVFMRPTRNHVVPPYAFVDAKHGRMEFLDRARTEVRSSGCSEDDIGDARALLDLLPIWCTCLGFAVVIAQGSTLFTKQGQTMDREIFYGLEIPAATLQSLVCLTILFLVPVYDWVLVPAAQSLTGRPTGISMLQRIGAGLFMLLLSMVIAALVEMQRLNVAADCGMMDDAGATLPMSVWWLAPQYMLFGLADVFAIVGLQEFFYDQVPSDLKKRMDMISTNSATGDDSTPLLDDVVRGVVGFDGGPAHRSKSGCWKSASFIIGVEVAERFAYYGISSNLISYLTGPLGESTEAAAAAVNAWNGAAMLLPLLGAFAADSSLGRYRTIIIASLLYVLGLGLLSLSATLHSSDSSPPPLEVVFFFFSLYLVAFAQGGHKPCVQAFGADQFDDEDEAELVEKSSFFNWWFRVRSSHKNPFVRIGPALAAAARARPTFMPTSMLKEESSDIEEARELLRIAPICASCLGYSIVFAQAPTLFTKQGSTMDRSFAFGLQIPSASLQSLTCLSIVAFIPLYDRVLPLWRGDEFPSL
ncbi:hypothetical protein SASPL_103542 [Salvia splendens]|uniref:Solute carrier family 15 (Peptide/histidine transporter), member 3/4 n=1 Tax=Salvia splendens TaxID=180675 RepID=A0A8X8YFE6_SALSN|nr:hypothetical protein SASPL_103542 [Salvia splendens]